MRRLLARLRERGGFTLVELVVALPMLTIVLGGMTIVFVQMQRTSSKDQQVAALQDQAREALQTMETDIRSAFIGDGTGPVTAATASSVTLYSPDRYPLTVSGGVASSFHLRQLTYSVSGGTLSKTVKTSTNTFPAGPPWSFPANGTTTSVMSSITNTDIFTYYTQDGIQANPDVALTFPISETYGIAAVKIKLTLSTSGPQSTSFTVTGVIGIRDPYQ